MSDGNIPDPDEGWSDVHLEREVLIGYELDGLHVTGSSLAGCELSGVSLAGADLWRVEIRDCRMSGVVLDGARLRDVTLTGCKLDTATFRGLKAERVVFSDCVLREADFTGSTWAAGCALFDCDLELATVAEGRWNGVRFHGSTIDRVIGADSLRGIVADPNQLLSLGLRVLDAMAVTADENRLAD